MKTYKLSMTKRKKYYHDFWKHSPECIAVAVISSISFLLTGIGLFKAILYIPTFKDVTVMIAMYLLCIAVVVIEWVIVRAIDISVKYRVALPHFSFLNYSLTLLDDSLKYEFWIGSKENLDAMITFGRLKGAYKSSNKHTYIIPKDNITQISVENGICFIGGNAELTCPACDKEKVKDFSFPVLFDCDDIKAEIIKWKNS